MDKDEKKLRVIKAKEGIKAFAFIGALCLGGFFLSFSLLFVGWNITSIFLIIVSVVIAVVFYNWLSSFMLERAKKKYKGILKFD